MIWQADITEKILKSGRNIFLLAMVLLLCSCGDDCSTIQQYINAGVGGNCLICAIFNTVADAAVAAADNSWKNLVKPLQDVIIVITAVYIALFTLKQISSMGKQNVADYITGDKKGVLSLIFKAVIIYILLDGATYGGEQWFIKYILNPILQSGLEIGNTVSTLNIKTPVFNQEGAGWSPTFDMIKEEVKAFNDNVYLMIAMGKAMICQATSDNSWGPLSWYWLMLLYGFIYFIFGWIMLAGAGLFMIDTGVTLAIAAVLLPFGIACAISDWSVSYTKNLWNMFLTVFFSFIILGIVVGLSLAMVLHCAGTYSPAEAEDAVFEVGELLEAADTPDITEQESKDLQEMIDENNAEELSEFLWSSGSLLLTVLCFLLIIQLLDQMKSLAQKLSDGTGFSPASQVGGDLTKPAAKGGKKLASWGGKAAGKVAKNTTSKVLDKFRLGRKIKSGYASLKSNIKGGYIAFRGKVFGIGPEGYKAWWRRR